MNELMKKHVAGLWGKPCCRKKIGDWRCLSIGFGEKIYHNNPKCVTPYYGEWEVGNYFQPWRVSKNNLVICGCKEHLEHNEELDFKLNEIDFGCIKAIIQPNNFDIHVELDNGIGIDFLAASSDDDETFHIFCPN